MGSLSRDWQPVSRSDSALLFGAYRLSTQGPGLHVVGDYILPQSLRILGSANGQIIYDLGLNYRARQSRARIQLSWPRWWIASVGLRSRFPEPIAPPVCVPISLEFLTPQSQSPTHQPLSVSEPLVHFCIRVRHSLYRFFLWDKSDGSDDCYIAQQLGYDSYNHLFDEELEEGTVNKTGWSLSQGDPFIGVGRRVRVVETHLSSAKGLPWVGLEGVVVDKCLRSGSHTVRLDAGDLNLNFLVSSLLDVAMEHWHDVEQSHGRGSYLARVSALCSTQESSKGKRKRAMEASKFKESNDRAAVNTYVRHLRLQAVGFACRDCGQVFSPETSRCLDFAHKNPKHKAKIREKFCPDDPTAGGLHRLGFYMDVASYTDEVWDECNVKCVGCHRAADNFRESDLTGQMKEYAEWRARGCQYGSDPDRDFGRQWRDGPMATQCIFDGSSPGWPAVQSALIEGFTSELLTPELTAYCYIMHGDHTGLVPDKHPDLKPSLYKGSGALNVSTLPKEAFQAELGKMRPLCFACDRWVTHGPPNVTMDRPYGVIYSRLVEALGNPLTDPGALEAFQSAKREWKRFMVMRSAGLDGVAVTAAAP